MTFDAGEYRKRVLTPYKGAKGSLLQAALRELNASPATKVPSGLDLADLYDMAPGMADADIAARVAEIGNCFTMCVTNAAFKSIGPSLVDLHKGLKSRNPDFATGAFWQNIGRAQAQRSLQDLNDFVTAAAGTLSSLGVVTADGLRALAKASRVPDSVSDAELAIAVGAHSITVVPEFRLPAAAVPPAVHSELRQTSSRSLLSAIFLQAEPTTFRIVDGYVGEDPSQRLTLDAVKSARSEIERRASSNDNDALKKVHGVLLTAATTDAALADLVLSYFVEVGKQLAAANPIPALALKKFVDSTGLDSLDAARVLLLFQGDAIKVNSFSEVQAKVAQGALKDARRLYDSALAGVAGSVTSEQTAAEAALVGAEKRLAALLTEARTAVEAGAPEVAATALNEALTICTDDESLAEMARDLPPAAPLRLVATTGDDGRRVRITWEPGFGSTNDVVYQVIRKKGAAPVGNKDGDVLVSGLTETAYEDASPPLAENLYYGVAATRGGGLSPLATATIVVLPPVRAVKVSAEPTSVTLRWETPPGARTVRVQQTAPDGAAADIPVNSQGGATSSGLKTGATYTYLVTAVYASATELTLPSEPVRVTAVPRGEARAVQQLVLTERVTERGETEVEATWTAVEGFDVEIWHYPEKPTWHLRDRIPMADVRSSGQRLSGRETGHGAQQGVRGAAGAGLRFYTAVTRDGDHGVVGDVRELGVCPPLTNVTVERFGNEVLLAWDWPGPEFDVHVAWSDGTTSGERVVTLSKYRGAGGCRVEVGNSTTNFRLSSTAAQAEGKWSSPETVLSVEAPATPVSYRVDFGRKLFGPPTSATLTFEAQGPSRPVDVVVVAHRGHVMPHDKTQGVIAQWRVDPSDPAASWFDVDLPRGRGPVWVRAFAANPESRLVDPPATQLKGD